MQTRYNITPVYSASDGHYIPSTKKPKESVELDITAMPPEMVI
jgi:hypothetical protein